MELDLWSVLPWLGFHAVYRWTREFRIFRQLERSQWWPREKLLDLQWAKLKRLLRHSYETVPLYKEKFRGAGLTPEDIKTHDDLRRLPVLTKEEIQRSREELRAGAGAGKARLNHTGGSTGEPLAFYQCSNFRERSKGEMLRDYTMCGYRVGGRVAFLWGADYDATAHNSRFSKMVDRVAMNLVWINTFGLERDKFPAYAAFLRRFEPELLVGYVSSLTMYARYVAQHEELRIRPRGIQSSAEALSPDDRDLLEETFGCPVFNRYGCREVGNIAHECEKHTGLHVLSENNLVELLDGEGSPVEAGKPGRVIVTNLNNYAMPFIRYEIGDVAVRSGEECPCGRGLPLLEKVVGRTYDIITSPSGKLVHGEYFNHVFYRVEGVRQFRVQQDADRRLTITLAAGEGFERESACSRAADIIHTEIDPQFEIGFEVVDRIETSPSGKYRFTSSEVPPQI
jgi:phenylacetate-CoA ligase